MKSCVYIKEIKNAPSALLGYKHAGIFKNMREVQRGTSRRRVPLCTSRVLLKIPACLYNSTMHKEQVFYFFYNI